MAATAAQLAGACQSAAPTMQSFTGLRADPVASRQAPASAAHNAATAWKSSSRTCRVVATKKVAKKKQIILTKDVAEVGKQGDLLSVRLGFFRNFLSPQGLAKTATPDILKAIREEQERLEAERRALLEEARKLARQFQTVGGFVVRRKGGMGKSFFGSVTKADLVDIIKANTGKDVKKDDIELPEIKEVGEFFAQIKLHPEVVADLRITVVGK